MLILRLLLLSAALLVAPLADAQTTTYRWINSAGQTVYSDQPPPADARQVVKISGDVRGDEQQLSYATRQAAEKFPVVLYTAAKCLEVCAQARDLLNERGIPFAEKMVGTDEEMADLTKVLGSSATIPSLVVGRQNFKGFEPGAWTNLLDLAGYPKTASYGAKRSGAFAQ